MTQSESILWNCDPKCSIFPNYGQIMAQYAIECDKKCEKNDIKKSGNVTLCESVSPNLKSEIE